MDFPMVTVPIIIRTLVVNLVRLSKADDIKFSADLVDFLHTPVAAGSDDSELPRYSLDWWNSDTFPCGDENPPVWMNFDNMAQCRSMDQVRRTESDQSQPRLHQVPHRIINVTDDHTMNTRQLPEGYCRLCAQLLEMIRILQQEMKATRNTYRGWEEIYKHRATMAQFRASGLHALLCVLASKDSAGRDPGATADGGGGTNGGASTYVGAAANTGTGPAAIGTNGAAMDAGGAVANASAGANVLSLAEVRTILEREMMVVDTTGHGGLDLDYLSPTFELSSLDDEVLPFDLVSDSKPPSELARAAYPDFFTYPPLGPDRGQPNANELPAGWKQTENTAGDNPGPSFRQIEEGTTLDPATIFYMDPTEESGFLKASTSIKQKFVPAVLSSSEGSRESHHPPPGSTLLSTFVPATVSSSESDGKAAGQELGKSTGACFMPATVSDSESDKAVVSAALAPLLLSTFVPATISSEDDAPAPASHSQSKFIPATLLSSEGEDDSQAAIAVTIPATAPPTSFVPAVLEDSDDDMSVSGDALAARINNAPMYTDRSFTHIPDDILEPDDDSEGGEYDEEYETEDGEYETDTDSQSE